MGSQPEGAGGRVLLARPRQAPAVGLWGDGPASADTPE